MASRARYFFALCALALIAAVVAGPINNGRTEDEMIVFGIAGVLLEEGETWVLEPNYYFEHTCIKEVSKDCDINQVIGDKVKDDKIFKCIVKYFKINCERCIKPKTQKDKD